MASHRDSNSNINDPIENSFDVDVVGLTELVDYKSDGDLFDFGSGVEFGLFGEDGVPLQQHSSYSSFSSGEKEVFTNASSQVSPVKAQEVKVTPKQTRRTRKNQPWNEMEKDLFLKGMELFGENWRKISKFIATKSAGQVKQHHKQWAETANVISDPVNFANDSSIYLPLESNEIDYLGMECNSSIGSIDTSLNTKCQDPNSSTDFPASESETDTEQPGMTFGEGMVVSSLHDWNLGSQVSVTEEDSIVNSSTNPLSIVCDTTSTKAWKGPNKKSQKISKRGTGIQSRMRRKGKKSVPSSTSKRKQKKSTQNIIGPSKTIPIVEGQIVHLNKNESEDSDVNIDDSEDEEIGVTAHEELVSFQNYSHGKGKVVTDDGNSTNYPEFHSLSENEKNFFSDSLQLKYCITPQKYISIRNKVINQWKLWSPSPLTKTHVIAAVDIADREIVKGVFDYLGNTGVIRIDTTPDNANAPQESSFRRIPSRRKRSRANHEKLCSDVMAKGGGVTISHDASGAVIDALHIPETSSNSRSNEAKRSTTSKHLKLLKCFKYDPDIHSPFDIVIDPEALVTLDLHCHSSTSEVIGLLGGSPNVSGNTLHVTVVVPTESSSSGVDCEMCPLSQMKGSEMIHQKGLAVVGWYHSHPCFLPNPSHRDLDTQTQLQNWFKRSNEAPFIGIIVSPFLPVTDHEPSSMIRCFVLDTPPSCHAEGLKEGAIDVDVPYCLEWKVQSRAKWRSEEVEQSVRDIIQRTKSHAAPVSWNQEWKNGMTFLDKCIASLTVLLPSGASELVHFVSCLIDS